MIKSAPRQLKHQKETDDSAHSYKMKIHVSSSGTQYVNAADLLFSDKEKFEMYKEAKDEAAKLVTEKR